MSRLEPTPELAQARPSIKVLFTSGYADGVLANRGILRQSTESAQQPTSNEVLAGSTRELLDGLDGKQD